MDEKELLKKIKNSEDSTEEEQNEETSNVIKAEKEKEEIELFMENRFYSSDEKNQRIALREGLKFNITRLRHLDEYINYERDTHIEDKEAIKDHIRELLLVKKNPFLKNDLRKDLRKDLYRTD